MTITAHQAILAFALWREKYSVYDIAKGLGCDPDALAAVLNNPPIVAVPDYMTPQFIRTSTDLIRQAIERRKGNASTD